MSRCRPSAPAQRSGRPDDQRLTGMQLPVGINIVHRYSWRREGGGSAAPDAGWPWAASAGPGGTATRPGDGSAFQLAALSARCRDRNGPRLQGGAPEDPGHAPITQTQRAAPKALPGRPASASSRRPGGSLPHGTVRRARGRAAGARHGPWRPARSRGAAGDERRGCDQPDAQQKRQQHAAQLPARMRQVFGPVPRLRALPAAALAGRVNAARPYRLPGWHLLSRGQPAEGAHQPGQPRIGTAEPNLDGVEDPPLPCADAHHRRLHRPAAATARAPASPPSRRQASLPPAIASSVGLGGRCGRS